MAFGSIRSGLEEPLAIALWGAVFHGVDMLEVGMLEVVLEEWFLEVRRKGME